MREEGLSRVAIIRCANYDPPRVVEALDHLIELLGGAEKNFPLEKNILLKPNLLKGAAPGKAVTTHPEVLRATIRAIKRARPVSSISVGDSPAWGSFQSAMQGAGLAAVCEDVGAAPSPFTRGVKVANPGGNVFEHLHIAREVVQAEAIINLPKLKTHCQMYMTGAVKNMFGCVAGKRKAWWHFKAGNYKDYFPLMIAETARLIAPRLSIMDAIFAMEGQGPSAGTPRRMGLLMASADPVALDRVAVDVAGLAPERMRTLAAADTIGWGETNLDKIEIVGLPISEARLTTPLVEPRMIPVGFSLPRVVKSTFKQQWLIRVNEPTHRVSRGPLK